MATLLNSISFVFKKQFLSKNLVIYYDYTVKWCSLINYNWGTLLDIVYILALSLTKSNIQGSHNYIAWLLEKILNGQSL